MRVLSRIAVGYCSLYKLSVSFVEVTLVTEGLWELNLSPCYAAVVDLRIDAYKCFFWLVT